MALPFDYYFKKERTFDFRCFAFHKNYGIMMTVLKKHSLFVVLILFSDNYSIPLSWCFFNSLLHTNTVVTRIEPLSIADKLYRVGLDYFANTFVPSS
jgi:hypothetical protein